MKNHQLSRNIAQTIYLVLGVSFLVFTCTDSPTAQLKQRAKAVIRQMETYRFGESRAWLQEFHDVMAEAANLPEAHSAIEKMMVGVLESKATAESKLIICKNIGLVGGGYCLTTLEKMMDDPVTQHMAILGLASLQGNNGIKILIAQIDKVDEAGKITIANVLALHPDASAIVSLRSLLGHEEHTLADAAANALSAIGGADCAQMLRDHYKKSMGEWKWKAAVHWLNAMAGEPDEARLAAAETVIKDMPPVSVYYMALKMKLACLSPEGQVTELISELKYQAPEFQEALLPVVRELPEQADLSPLIQTMNELPEGIKYQLMVALADRHEPAIRSLLLTTVKGPSPEGRLMALKGLEKVSNSQDIGMLTGIAAGRSEEEQALARSCIYWMNDANTDRTIVELASRSNTPEKAELLKAIGYRKITSGKEIVFANIKNPNEGERQAAIFALGKIGTSTDLPASLDVLLSNTNKADAEPIKNTILAMALRSEQTEASSQLLADKLAAKPGTNASVTTINVLGELGDDSAFEALKSSLDSDNADIQFAAFKAFSGWHDDRPIAVLEQSLMKAIPQSSRSQGVVSLVILIQNSRALSGDEKVAKLADVYSRSENTFDKKTLINGISRIWSIKALDFAIGRLAEANITEVAQEATLRVAGDLREGFRDEVKSRMETLLQTTTDEAFKAKVSTLIKSMEL